LCLIALCGLVLPSTGVAGQNQAETTTVLDEFLGNYREPDGRLIGIDRFDMDGGQTALLYSHYVSGVVRRMYPAGNDRFEIGASFGVPTPVEGTFRFVRNERRDVVAVALQMHGEKEIVAKRLPLTRRDVSFQGQNAALAGTVLIPGNIGGKHPAIILLHGSGQLGRYSFGPYPHFFTSLGLSVLIFDKRGTGSSTGEFFPRSAIYPGPLLADALAAMEFMRARPDVDRARIGLWGTSEGGMLATQVAAQSKSVRFLINSSGFMTPLWQQVLFNIEAQLRADGFPPGDVAEAVAFERLAIETMRTGQGWNEYERAQSTARNRKWFTSYFGQGGTFASLDDLRWQWDHVYSFDPLPALKSVTCPVLGVFGALDTSTPPSLSEANMRRVLGEAGNRDVKLMVFPNANHPLMEARTGGNAEIPTLKRQVPGLFETLRSWISDHTNQPADRR
jgi:pimeloyl-ACP methyl ester carboxylesterase